MTKRDVISAVRNAVKQHHSDTRLSNRKIFEVINRKLKSLLDRDMRDRKLYRQNFLFKTICIEFEEVSANACSCISLPTECTLYKSKRKVPKLYESIYGSLVQSISTIDRSKKIYLNTPENAQRKAGIKHNSDKYAFIDNEYLYQINSEYPLLLITALFESNTSNYECGCPEAVNETCVDNLATELIVPDRLLDPVITSAIEELMKSFSQIKYQQLNDKNSET